MCEAAAEEIRQASRPLFVLGALGCLSLFVGDVTDLAIAAVLLALATLLRFKQSRIAAITVSLFWCVGLVLYVTSHAGLPTWPERMCALFFVLCIVSGCLAVRATFRFHRAFAP